MNDEEKTQPEPKLAVLLGLTEQELRRELQIAVDQIDAGDVQEWDLEEILQEAHRRHSLRPQ